jgi:hypothetical protein
MPIRAAFLHREPASDVRHELHEAARTGAGIDARIEGAFLPLQAENERRATDCSRARDRGERRAVRRRDRTGLRARRG